MQSDFQDYLFVFCVIFLIIIAILFAGVVSYLYILFKDYLDSLA
jgi:ABC-type polysaccharide/polyol phosphate export permease